MGAGDLAGFEAIPRYKHYKNAITNAVHLQMSLSLLDFCVNLVYACFQRHALSEQKLEKNLNA